MILLIVNLSFTIIFTCKHVSLWHLVHQFFTMPGSNLFTITPLLD